MYKEQKITVIIAAAGSGTRMGGSLNKQYIKLGDMPVLARTLRAFDSHPAVDDIIIVMAQHEMESCKSQIVEGYGLKKVTGIIAGGKQRQDSVKNALDIVTCDEGYVLIQDGARPFITKKEIDDVLEAVFLYGAAAVAVPVKDTIKVTSEDGFIQSTPDRKTLYAVQTPQAFELTLIRDAFQKAYEDGFYGTDETVLLERMGKRVYISKGSYSNIKITTPEDVAIGEALLAAMD